MMAVKDPDLGPRLAGRTVVVTGAGQGIGAEIARRIAHEGGTVVAADRDLERATAVAEECRAHGGRARAVHVDVTDPASCAGLGEEGADERGAVHGLVNCAAMFSTIEMKPFWEIDPREWDNLMAVNLRGPWLVTSRLLPRLRRAGDASVVHIGSDSMWQGKEGYLHYVSSKSGLLGMTFAMAHEIGGDGIRVNTVSPAAVITEIPRATVTEDQKTAMRTATPLDRLAGPQDIASVVTFLLSPDAGFVSGQVLSVNGGLIHR